MFVHAMRSHASSILRSNDKIMQIIPNKHGVALRITADILYRHSNEKAFVLADLWCHLF